MQAPSSLSELSTLSSASSASSTPSSGPQHALEMLWYVRVVCAVAATLAMYPLVCMLCAWSPLLPIAGYFLLTHGLHSIPFARRFETYLRECESTAKGEMVNLQRVATGSYLWVLWECVLHEFVARECPIQLAYRWGLPTLLVVLVAVAVSLVAFEDANELSTAEKQDERKMIKIAHFEWTRTYFQRAIAAHLALFFMRVLSRTVWVPVIARFAFHLWRQHHEQHPHESVASVVRSTLSALSIHSAQSLSAFDLAFVHALAHCDTLPTVKQAGFWDLVHYLHRHGNDCASLKPENLERFAKSRLDEPAQSCEASQSNEEVKEQVQLQDKGANAKKVE